MTKTINIPLGKKEDSKLMTINVGSSSFEIAVDDKSMERLINTCEKISHQFENSVIETMSDAKKLVKDSFTAILGKGSFKKVYEESGSVIECTEVLLEVAKGITENYKK